MMLLTCYLAYVTFMAYNHRIEKLVKSILTRKRIASSANTTYITQVRLADVFRCFQGKAFILLANESDCSFIMVYQPIRLLI